MCCSYRKISGDTCTGGDIESRLEGELVPCPLAGEYVQDCSGHKGFIHKTVGLCLRDHTQIPRGLSDKTYGTGAQTPQQVSVESPLCS